jgi:heme-degrading monooxygenase HmoA
VIALIFTYEATDSAEFERAYGADGDWARFFATGSGFIGTELLRDVEAPGRYVVVDRWETRDAYNEFVAANRDEYMRRVDDAVFHHTQELRLGTFESVW